MRAALRLCLIPATAALVAIAPVAVAQGSPDVAKRFVQGFSDDTMAVLRDRERPESEREVRLKAILSKGLALDIMGRFALGGVRRQATAEQRTAYAMLFSKYVLKTYSRRLLRHRIDNFKVVSAKPVGKRDAAVESRVARPSAPDLALTWRVRQIEGRQKIVDVLIDGLSVTLTLRSEVTSVVRREGMEALLAKFRARISGEVTAQESTK